MKDLKDVVIYTKEIKEKKEDRRNTYLVWLMTYLEPLHVLPCFGGVQRISHRIKLSPHSRYIIKPSKNEVIRILRRRTSS